MFGRGRDGQLGRGGELTSIAGYSVEPKQVMDLKTIYNADVQELALGNNHSLALCIKRSEK